MSLIRTAMFSDHVIENRLPSVVATPTVFFWTLSSDTLAKKWLLVVEENLLLRWVRGT
jgi:hypothetical protein